METLLTKRFKLSLNIKLGYSPGARPLLHLLYGMAQCENDTNHCYWSAITISKSFLEFSDLHLIICSDEVSEGGIKASVFLLVFHLFLAFYVKLIFDQEIRWLVTKISSLRNT